MSGPSIGHRVARLRALSGCSTQALADAIGVSRALVNFLETGVRADPRSSTVVAIAHACGVSFSWLLDGEGPEPEPEAVRAAVERARAQRTQEAA